MFRLVDPDSLILAISVEESRLSQLEPGQPAEVTFDALPGQPFPAHVRRISPTVEQGAVRATLDLAPEAQPVLKEGLFARVRLVVDVHRDALLVPKDAIVEESGRRYLYTIAEEPEGEDGTVETIARRVEVKTGYESGTHVAVLEGVGMQPIVVLGQQTLKPDTPVLATNMAEALREARDAADGASASDGSAASEG